MRDLDQTIIKFDYDKNFKNEDFYQNLRKITEDLIHREK